MLKKSLAVELLKKFQRQGGARGVLGPYIAAERERPTRQTSLFQQPARAGAGMGRQNVRAALATRLRRQGVRVSGGPWTLCGLARGTGQVIVSLGAAAGGAVTRSRVRRVARTVLRTDWARAARLDLLLLARSSLAGRPRRRVRSDLSELLARLLAALRRPGGTQEEHG